MTNLLTSSTDWQEFGEFYNAALEGGTLFEQTRTAPLQVNTQARLNWECTGSITYCGQDVLKREIDTLREAIGDTAAADAFLTSTAPASLEPGRKNRYYKSEEEFVFALAEAMSVECRAIADAGFQLQVDDAWLDPLGPHRRDDGA